MRKVTAVLLLTVGSLFMLPSAACACSCAPSSEVEYREHADLIFTGVVTNIDEPPTPTSSLTPVAVTFAVEDVEKGTPVQRVTLVTANSSASCGYDFIVGNRFAVYAKGGETGLCSGNRIVWSTPGVAAESGVPLAAILGAGGGLVAVGAAIYIWRRRMARTDLAPPRHPLP